jgi:hypothetical protein
LEPPEPNTFSDGLELSAAAQGLQRRSGFLAQAAIFF